MAYSHTIKLHPIRHQQLAAIAKARGFKTVADLVDSWISRDAQELDIEFPGVAESDGAVTLDFAEAPKVSLSPDQAQSLAHRVNHCIGVTDQERWNARYDGLVMFTSFARAYRLLIKPWQQGQASVGMTRGIAADFATALKRAAAAR